jgi:hypothetical protein
VIAIDFDGIRRQVPLPEFLLSLGLELRPQGDTYRCRCPLHNEKHGASLIVYPDGHWYCHGKCARGGDVIDFARALWGLSDVRTTVEKLLAGGPLPTLSSIQPARAQTTQRKWPARNFDRIREIVACGLDSNYLQKASPVQFDPGKNHAEETIDIIFPGDPLLCCGLSEFKFRTRYREDWRGLLSKQQFIVPNPMLENVGLTQAGKWSEHAQSATARRVYLVIEFDFSEFKRDGVTLTEWAPLMHEWTAAGITVADACSALHLHMKSYLPLVMVVSSGGRSLHGWYYVFNREESHLFPIMRHAYSLGADHVTWNRAQFCRMPDGTRVNGKRQALVYLDPGKAVKNG